MTDEQAKPPAPSPFHGFDYPSHEAFGLVRPTRSDAIGRLAIDLQQLAGVGGIDALSAAILLDQGRAEEALDLLTGCAADLANEADEKKRKALERRARA